MRAFLAVELPPAVQAALHRLADVLAQAHGDVKWVEQDNLHITMRFLGEISDQQRQATEQLLQQVASRHASCSLTLENIGAFPTVDGPRVIWVGVGQGRQPLEQIAQELEAGVRELGFEPEHRTFAAHVTLGRVRTPRNLSRLWSQLKTVSWTPPPAFTADHLTLFHSTLSIHGSAYTPLVRSAFSLPQ